MQDTKVQSTVDDIKPAGIRLSLRLLIAAISILASVIIFLFNRVSANSSDQLKKSEEVVKEYKLEVTQKTKENIMLRDKYDSLIIKTAHDKDESIYLADSLIRNNIKIVKLIKKNSGR